MSYLDNDELYKPNVGDSSVYTLSEDIPVSKEVLAKKYPKVFNMGVGKLEREYHIRLDPKMNPVKHAPRRVPVALRAPLTNTLEDMVRQDIIAPVTKPTSWISSMVVVPKKMVTCVYFWIRRTSIWLSNVNITHYQPLKMLRHDYMGPNFSQFWMYTMDFGMLCSMNHYHSSPHFSHLLGGTGGSVCLLDSALHLRCFNVECKS